MRLLLVFVLSIAAAFPANELSGRRAPGFSLPDSTGKLYDPQDYRGKLLIVDFMQTACPHCAEFSKILEQVRAKYRDRVAILSIVNPPSDTKSVGAYIAEHKVTTPILFDCGQVAYSYLRPKSNSIAVPHVFLIDSQGMIQRDYGHSDANKEILEGRGLFPVIDQLLAAPKR
ncbi:MAG: peroxiredoxin family protein [Bryobacteraceae bacterium]